MSRVTGSRVFWNVLLAALLVTAFTWPVVAAGTLSVGVNRLPPTPYPYQQGTISQFNLLVYDTLIVIDENGDIQPALATSWVQESPISHLFTLRDDVRFHNGDPLTAEDVKFSFEHILDPANRLSLATRVDTIKSVEVVDTYTVRFITHEPDPLLVRRLAFGHIVPKRYFEEVGLRGFEANPIGSGPFVVKEFVADQRTVLAKNADYWGPIPEMDEIVLYQMLEGSVRVSALLTGELDLITFVPTDLAPMLEAAPGIKVVSALRGRTNMHDYMTLFGGPLADRRVRLAMNLAVDKEALVEAIAGGYGEIAYGQLVAPHAFGFNPDLEPYPYDPERAKQLLAEAGYPNGFDVTITVTNHEPERVAISEAVAAFLAEVGIRAQLNVVEYATYLERFYGPPEERGDLFSAGLGYMPMYDADFVLQWLACNSARLFWCNAEFDEVYHASRVEMDAEKREELLRKAAEIVYREVPVMPLFYPSQIIAMKDDIEGVLARPDDMLTLWSARRVQ